MAILITDLRIGNWLLTTSDEYKKVKNIQEESINNVLIDSFNGIPLTPEILEKCGFKFLHDWNNGDVDIYSNDRITLQINNIIDENIWLCLWRTTGDLWNRLNQLDIC